MSLTERRTGTDTAARRRGGIRALGRVLPWTGGLLLAGLLVLGLWPKPPTVETVRVAAGPMQVTISEEGRTRIRERYLVASPVAGELRRVEWKAGADVRGGVDVLAVIEPLRPGLLDPRTRALAEARLEVARAALSRAEEAHRFARSELRRFEQLGSGRVVSPQELEGVQWREASAGRDLEVARSSLRQAEAEVREYGSGSGAEARPVEVRAPVTGRVLRVFEGSARAVSAGVPLMELGDLAELEAVIEVLSRDAAGIEVGARVRVVEPSAFTKVSALGVEEQRVNVVLDLLTPAQERRALGDQYRVEGRIVVWEVERTLKVPTGALFRSEGGWAAFRCEAGRLVERRVKVGRTNGPETEILEGLGEGDEVVSHPGDRLRDGQRFQRASLRDPG